MPRKSKKKLTQHTPIGRTKSVSFREALSEKVRFGESYTSLILGIVVVVVASILVISVVRNRTTAPTSQPKQEVSSDKTEKPLEEVAKEELPTTYTVVEGDDLWTISEKVYKSGYNWVDIAEANKLENPDVVVVGTKLTLPKVTPKEPTVVAETGQALAPPVDSQEKGAVIPEDGSNKITGNSYTVVAGDILWDIAIRAYNDGYKWPEIARASNLANPDVIEVGQKLSIPR